MNYNLSDFIDTFLNDFSEKIADDISVKLLILKFLDRHMTTEKIKTEISKQYPEYLLRIKELSFSKKVRRIKKKYTQIYDIPELISINHLTKMILEKYPRPGIIGLPFESWNAENIYNFIRFYFKFPDDQRIADLNIDTIHKYICAIHPKRLSIKETDDYYYITIIRKPYINIPTSNQGNKRYNYLYYGAVFLINNNYLERIDEKIISVSEAFNDVHAFHPFISELLKRIPNSSKGKPIIFIRKNKAYKNCIFRKQENFHEYFRFNWCPFENYAGLSNILKKNEFHIKPSGVDNLKKIFSHLELIEKEYEKINKKPILDFFEFNKEKEYYIHEIHTIQKSSPIFHLNTIKF